MMSVEQLVALRDVLTERREEVSAARISDDHIPIVAKIRFSDGEMELRDGSGTNTRMILAYPGDLLVSGINATKGAIALVDPSRRGPVAATIHYSAYAVATERASPAYLRRALRSRAFRHSLTAQLPGGIKSELRAKRLLAVRLPIPDRGVQDRLMRTQEAISQKVGHIQQLAGEVVRMTSRIPFLMLQRSTSAESLGPLSEVLDGKPRNGWSPTRTADNDGVPILSLAAVTGFRYRPDQFKRTAVATNPSGHYWLRTGDLLITRSNSPGLVGHAAVYSGEPSPCIYPDLMMRIPVDRSRADPGFVHKWLATPVVRDYIEGRAKGTSPTMKKISQSVVANIPFPSSLPLARQIELSRLVEKVWDQANHVVANTTANVREIEQLDDLLLEESFQPAAPA